MKKLENKTISLNGGFIDIGKAGDIKAFADFKSNKDDIVSEEIERENSKSVFIKLMNQYINRLNLQVNK